jgi:hypothetical protein
VNVVVGIVFDSLVVIDRESARRDVVIIDALEGSRTWGDLRERLSGTAPQFLADLWEGHGPSEEDDLPTDLMDPELWPAPALGLTYDVLPEDLAARFGDLEVNPSGTWLRIDPVHRTELAAALEARGWTIVEDQGLVERFQLC